jgi:hypothetical protein
VNEVVDSSPFWGQVSAHGFEWRLDQAMALGVRHDLVDRNWFPDDEKWRKIAAEEAKTAAAGMVSGHSFRAMLQQAVTDAVKRYERARQGARQG